LSNSAAISGRLSDWRTAATVRVTGKASAWIKQRAGAVANPVVDLLLRDRGQVKVAQRVVDRIAISGAVSISVPSRSNMIRSKALVMTTSEAIQWVPARCARQGLLPRCAAR
jgi:hypothetical protein